MSGFVEGNGGGLEMTTATMIGEGRAPFTGDTRRGVEVEKRWAAEIVAGAWVWVWWCL